LVISILTSRILGMEPAEVGGDFKKKKGKGGGGGRARGEKNRYELDDLTTKQILIGTNELKDWLF